jgi:hypothetical protein
VAEGVKQSPHVPLLSPGRPSTHFPACLAAPGSGGECSHGDGGAPRAGPNGQMGALTHKHTCSWGLIRLFQARETLLRSLRSFTESAGLNLLVIVIPLDGSTLISEIELDS